MACAVFHTAVAVVLLSICYVATAEDGEHPIVKLEQGAIRGKKSVTVWNKEYFSFLGIRYAKPPVGERRFKAPEPLESWKGIYNATMDGEECPQIKLMYNTVGGDEDCLFLNVLTPKLPENAENPKLPVMVFIHGGKFTFGSANSNFYGPDYFLSEDVILCPIQYRLGLLGFSRLSEAGICGNNGMKDQVMALRWVQKNIEKFGGDPNKITVFGESAGAASTHYHMLSNMSKALFNRAILQSGTAVNSWAFSEPEAMEKWTKASFCDIGCNTTDSKELHECLKKVPFEKFIDPFNMKATPTLEDTNNINCEEAFLTEHPKDIISSGKFNHVPMIAGTNSYESAFFVSENFPANDEELNKRLNYEAQKTLHLSDKAKRDKMVEDIKRIYYTNETIVEGTVNLYTDIWFLLGACQTVDAHSAISNTSVHYYYFAYAGNMSFSHQIQKNRVRVPCHADELGYQFRMSFGPKLDMESDDAKTVLRLAKMWTNFAKTGNPTSEMNSVLDIKWPRYTATNKNYLKIDKNLSTGQDLHKERMALWKEFTSHK